jgi:hypothetical protein
MPGGSPVKHVKRNSVVPNGYVNGRGRDETVGLGRPTSMQAPQSFAALRGTGADELSPPLAPSPSTSPSEGGRRFLDGVRRISFGAVKKNKAAAIPAPTKTPIEEESARDNAAPHGSRTLPNDSTPRARTRRVSAAAAASLPNGLDTLVQQPPEPLSRVPPSSDKLTPTASPQVLSLGRAANPLVVAAGGTPVAKSGRRNSLGDLKIPPRIVQAQSGLKRDLGMVKEFAASIERTSFSIFASILKLSPL